MSLCRSRACPSASIAGRSTAMLRLPVVAARRPPAARWAHRPAGRRSADYTRPRGRTSTRAPSPIRGEGGAGNPGVIPPSRAFPPSVLGGRGGREGAVRLLLVADVGAQAGPVALLVDELAD